MLPSSGRGRFGRLVSRGRPGGRIGVGRGRICGRRWAEIVAGHLGLLLDAAGQRNVALELRGSQVVADLLLGKMSELDVATHREQHPVIGSQSLYLSGHIGSVSAKPPAFIHEPVPGIDIFRAVDERLFAVHFVHGLLRQRSASDCA